MYIYIYILYTMHLWVFCLSASTLVVICWRWKLLRWLQPYSFQSWSCTGTHLEVHSYPQAASWTQPQRSLVVVMWGRRGPSGTRVWFVRLRFALGFVLQLSECSVSVWAWQGKLQPIVNFLQKGAFSKAKPICKIKLNLGSHFSLPSSFWELRDVFLEVPT